MKLRPNCLEFYDIERLLNFVEMYDFNNLLQLDNQISDNAGRVVVKPKTLLTDNILRRLIEKQDEFEPIFKVLFTNEFIAKVNFLISDSILKRLNLNTNTILKHLLSNNEKVIDYKGIISNAFSDPAISITLFNYYISSPDYFNHIADMGLMTLAVCSQQNQQLKFLHRYAFLSGLFIDISMADTPYWKFQNFDEPTVHELATISASIADKINLPYEVVTTIETPVHTVLEDKPIVKINMDTIYTNNFFSEITRKAPMQQDESSESIIKILLESTKISKFLKEINNRLLQDSNADVKVLSMFSYNLEKGYFSPEIATGILKKFEEYEEIVSSIRHIAQVERACPFQSAWAYPKPKSTQILCQKKLLKCPLSIRGRDISVVNKLTPFGYIGLFLEKGSYPKCKLDEKLKRIDELT